METVEQTTAVLNTDQLLPTVVEQKSEPQEPKKDKEKEAERDATGLAADAINEGTARVIQQDGSEQASQQCSAGG